MSRVRVMVSSHRLCCFIVSCMFLLILQPTQMRFTAQGRPISKPLHFFPGKTGNEEETMVRSRIGSRPPKCEKRCNSCGHCEAIQVPANPQRRTQTTSNSSTFYSPSYDRRDESSNYKPMSWKCKCGNFIFNP